MLHAATVKVESELWKGMSLHSERNRFSLSPVKMVKDIPCRPLPWNSSLVGHLVG